MSWLSLKVIEQLYRQKDPLQKFISMKKKGYGLDSNDMKYFSQVKIKRKVSQPLFLTKNIWLDVKIKPL